HAPRGLPLFAFRVFSHRLIPTELLLDRLLPFASRLLPSRLAHVAVYSRGVVAGAAQVARNLVGDHHGAVAPARAADADGHVGLALALVEREQVVNQLCEAPDRFLHFAARVEELDDAAVVARKVAQFGDEVWVR